MTSVVEKMWGSLQKGYANTIKRVTRKGYKVIVSLLALVKHRDLDSASEIEDIRP